MGIRRRLPFPGRYRFLSWIKPNRFFQQTQLCQIRTNNLCLYTNQLLNPQHQHHDSQLLLQYVLVHKLQ